MNNVRIKLKNNILHLLVIAFSTILSSCKGVYITYTPPNSREERPIVDLGSLFKKKEREEKQKQTQPVKTAAGVINVPESHISNSSQPSFPPLQPTGQISEISSDTEKNHLVSVCTSEMRNNGWERLALVVLNARNSFSKDNESCLIEELVTRFSSLKEFSIVEKSLLDHTFTELGMTLSGIVNLLSDTELSVNREAVKKFGELTSADVMIVVMIAGNSEIDYYLVDTETGNE